MICLLVGWLLLQMAHNHMCFMQIGLALHHDSVFMVMTHSNFLIEVQNNYQSGTTQLQHAKKCNPTLADKFAIFVREQVGSGGDMPVDPYQVSSCRSLASPLLSVLVS